MIIAGVNIGTTRSGLRLKDGGACLLHDGNVVIAVAEERLARTKHAGGFDRALDYCLTAAGIAVRDLDLVVVSNCAEAALADGSDIGLLVDSRRVIGMPSHHLSHAHAAFLTSPFEDAAIMVFDNEGNRIGQSNCVEQNSYYFGRGTTIVPLAKAADRLQKTEVGLGEAYRHFTHFLGWHSYTFAGHTMGLASLGARDAFGGLQVFDLRGGQIHSNLKRRSGDPIAAVAELARSCGIVLGPSRQPGEDLTGRHADIAALIQAEFERALIYKANVLHELTGAKDLCLGGGAALNCVANRRLLTETPFERIYVHPAPGDTGQCIGNALFGWTEIARQTIRPQAMSAFQGKTYSPFEIKAAIAERSTELLVDEQEDPCRVAAEMLADGHVLGWFQGRSELGPRALGARSILADSRPAAMRDYLNVVVKKRETFRPFASSVLLDDVSDFFDLDHPSRFMELVGQVRPSVRHLIPAVVHADGSSRIQTVISDETRLSMLLESFRTVAGFPVILNTSFNLSGEPIVESPADAIDCFLRSALDALMVGNFLVRRVGDVRTPRFHAWT